MSDEEAKGPRRVRYNGTHPKSFKEKYKRMSESGTMRRFP